MQLLRFARGVLWSIVALAGVLSSVHSQEAPKNPSVKGQLSDTKKGGPKDSTDQAGRTQKANETPPPELLEKAKTGDVAAQLELAVRYRDGKGVARDHAEALRWAHMAADRGDLTARDFVGWMYFHGLGVRRNTDIAAGYFKSAAAKSPSAAWNLGQCYFAAQGVEHSIPKALEYWKKAAEMGHGRAASSAAMVYLAGDGVAADPVQARKLAERAVELNDPSGLVVLGEIHFRANELDKARELWTKVSQTRPTGATGKPTQSSSEMAAQQGADLLKLIPFRTRKAEPGKFALVDVHHVHQGWNNCGATSCAIFARSQGQSVGGWDFKKLCPPPFGEGTDWADLVSASPKIGLKWKLITFPADDSGFEKATAFVRSEIDAGRPVVIDFKYLGPQYPNGHAGHTLVLAGYLAEEGLYVLCNPAIATPGLELITADDLKHYWRSDYYSRTSNRVLSRPAIVVDRESESK